MINLKSLLFIATLLSLYFVSANTCVPNADGEDTFPLGNECFTASEIATCNENLSKLDNKEENNDSITNICEPQIENGAQVYDFTVQFQNGFEPNLDCLSFEIKFESTTLEEGAAVFNEW